MDISCYLQNSDCFIKNDESKLIKMIINSDLKILNIDNKMIRCKLENFKFTPSNNILSFEFSPNNEIYSQETIRDIKIKSNYYEYDHSFNFKEILRLFKIIKDIISNYIKKTKLPPIVIVFGQYNKITKLLISRLTETLIAYDQKFYFLESLGIYEERNLFFYDELYSLIYNKPFNVEKANIISNTNTENSENVLNINDEFSLLFFSKLQSEVFELFIGKKSGDIGVYVKSGLNNNDLIFYLAKIVIFKTLKRHFYDSPGIKNIYINLNFENSFENDLDINELIFNDKYVLYNTIKLLDVFEGFSYYANRSPDYLPNKIKFYDMNSDANDVFFNSNGLHRSFSFSKMSIWEILELIENYEYLGSIKLNISTIKIKNNELNKIFDFLFKNDIPNLESATFFPREESFEKYYKFKKMSIKQK